MLKHSKPRDAALSKCDDVEEQKSKELLVGRNQRKTFSANFHSTKYKIPSEVSDIVNNKGSTSSNHHHLTENCLLKRENVRLLRENKELMANFEELQEISLRKIKALKAKLSKILKINKTLHKNKEADVGLRNEELIRTCSKLQIELDAAKVCSRCDDFRVENDKLLNENGSLKDTLADREEDMNMLKTVVYRLNEQMERYQNKLREMSSDPADMENNSKVLQNKSHKIIHLEPSERVVRSIEPFLDTDVNHRGHRHIPQTWGSVNGHTLGPLLDAYVDALDEKHEIITEYELHFQRFLGKFNEIVNENEKLHLVLSTEVASNKRDAIENRKNTQIIDCMKQKSDCLQKKYNSKVDEVKEIISQYEHKVQQLKTDLDTLTIDCNMWKSQADSFKSKNKVLVATKDDFHTEMSNYILLSVHNACINELKRLHEDLQLKYDEEKLKLCDEIKKYKNTADNCHAKLLEYSNSKQLHKNRIAYLEKQIRYYENQCSLLRRALTEVQVSHKVCKVQLHKTMNFAKDVVEEQEALLKIVNKCNEGTEQK